jgi:hypothetical protein
MNKRTGPHLPPILFRIFCPDKPVRMKIRFIVNANVWVVPGSQALVVIEDPV